MRGVNQREKEEGSPKRGEEDEKLDYREERRWKSIEQVDWMGAKEKRNSGY